MGRVGRWARAALSGLFAASCCLGISDPALAADAGSEVGGWRVGGAIEAGGMGVTGEHGSSKFNQYRDMDSGFLGELSLKGEKKDSPYYFDLGVKNPGIDDQAYEGALGRFGLFHLEFDWNRTPHILSNSASTIYEMNGGAFVLPASQRAAIQAAFTTGPTTLAGRNNIARTIDQLSRPVDLGFNTDVGKIGFKLTPVEGLRFDLEYSNIRREGKRPIGVQLAGSTSGPVHELAVPVENNTNEIKFGMEYAQSSWGVNFGYTGSFFRNGFSAFDWDNPNLATSTGAANASDRFSVAPDNYAHAFNLTGTAALPLRSRINGTFAYTMLRQDQDFEYSTANPLLAGRTNTDDAGRRSADARANLVLANVVLTSRPITSLTSTVRFRYFEYQNDTPQHVFTNTVFTGGGATATSGESKNERYTKMNTGLDLGWRPFRKLSLKAGYEFEHWSRADYGDLGDTGATHPNFSNHEHIAKLAADVTPVDWFLGRLTYTYGDRSLVGYNVIPTTDLANSVKYPFADRRRHRVDALFQFTPWETLTSSLSAGYALDDFHKNDFGLTKDDYFTAGINLDWSPLAWLTLSGDYSYEQYKWDMTSRYLVGGVFPGISANDWRSKTKDEFHNIGVNASIDIVPKKFGITLGYTVGFGYTSYENSNPNLNVGGVTNVPAATAYSWDKVFNVLQTFRIVAKYRMTDKMSLRGGFAYERANERNWATDPMAPFMGNYDSTTPGGAPVTQGVQSVWLGATQPNYEAYIFSAVLRYEF